jgi:hypothetical protein
LQNVNSILAEMDNRDSAFIWKIKVATNSCLMPEDKQPNQQVDKKCVISKTEENSVAPLRIAMHFWQI